MPIRSVFVFASKNEEGTSDFKLIEVIIVYLKFKIMILGNLRDNFSNQITDADEACRSSEISVDLIIIIVFL